MSDEGVWCCDRMKVTFVKLAESVQRWGVEDISVRVVLDNLENQFSPISQYPRLGLTSRRSSTFEISFAMDQGIGRVVVTFNALRT